MVMLDRALTVKLQCVLTVYSHIQALIVQLQCTNRVLAVYNLELVVYHDIQTMH